MHISCYLVSRDEESSCHLILALNGKYKTFNLPNIISPYKKRNKGHYIGANGEKVHYDYEQIIPRQYGFLFDHDFIMIYYGINSGESNIDKKWSYTFPWLEETYIKKDYLNLDGTIYKSVPYSSGMKSPFWDICREVEKEITKQKIRFNDFDGEEIEAECYCVKQYYHKGTKWCNWLKYITKNKCYKRIEVSYNKEVGDRKNSWKGGTLSSSWWVQDESLSLLEIFKSNTDAKKFSNIEVIE